MRVALVGNFDPEFSTENDIRKAFEFLSWEVVKLQESRATWLEVREASVAADLLLWIGTWDDA